MTTKKTTKTKTAASALGRLGGGARTAMQNEARRQNAQYGGRPGRVCCGCGQPVHGGHKDRSLDATCNGQAWRWKKPQDR